MDKYGNLIKFGLKVAAGGTAAYLVDKIIDDKAKELVNKGGIVNAAVVGFGQGAIAVVVFKIVFGIY